MLWLFAQEFVALGLEGHLETNLISKNDSKIT